jgi:NO-binding membrane sensor protein with MHYT domain
LGIDAQKVVLQITFLTLMNEHFEHTLCTREWEAHTLSNVLFCLGIVIMSFVAFDALVFPVSKGFKPAPAKAKHEIDQVRGTAADVDAANWVFAAAATHQDAGHPRSGDRQSNQAR